MSSAFRYRKADERDLRDGHDTVKRVPEGRNASSRFAGGKNPFGQVSATGAFKPAGRDLGDHNRVGPGRNPCLTSNSLEIL